MERHYYHCATKGLSTDVLFSSRDQFIAGMNRVGLCALSFPNVVIIAFVLMDNHVHFILHGTYKDCIAFMEKYKRLTEIYLNVNAPSEKSKEWKYEAWLIPNKEKLAEKICYVLRNPLAAGMGIHPSCYHWGSGPLMFAGRDADLNASAVKLGEMSVYKQRKIFKTKIRIPSEWMADQEGLVWPGSYVDYRKAERVFDTVYDYMYQLNKKNEEMINAEMYGCEISLQDKDLIRILSNISKEEFGESDCSLLGVNERLALCGIVRRSHNADIKQLSRLLHIKPADLKLIMR